ncbi:MAG: DUF5686 and carboxypeptidase regulatory-like domain-containing protein [Daejeonella sp.]|uniref:DUF5686 and carboxypeptidase regulatory-like domain-containing protein n=1 Tax=Daejeonella sp. TaxID=2805397 RepID=UPI0027367447|nr:DUF5686 and carboxypeptidase regulatory-like domain-containing protein [Daejeonella sp.]MDP3468019.1 DUF5686 and carboxypeptidase regulatory-like domain-containing protein [Daejeonella sp.]
MKSLFVFLLFILFSHGLYAQNIILKGKITNSKGLPVPFASVYVQNTTRGTSANSDGEFQLKLKPGKHTIIFKAIGFSQESREMDLQSDQYIQVSLTEAVYELKDVIVRAYSEDPAYEVIRNAIRERNYHLNEINEFTAEVYIKGMQKLLAAPKKFLGRNIDDMAKQIGLDSNRKGILYLSESESILSYIKPGKYREVMISSKVSGSNRAFSFNRASDMGINFYQNLLEMEGLSPRPFISPIADNALFYYRYRLLGTSMENGQMINKIELIPKRAADPVFRGVIYILEDSWRIHSADLYLTKEANIQFVDTLNISQEFIPVNAKTWMPSAVRFDFTGGFLGFNFGGYFIALYNNYDLNPRLNPKDFREVLQISREVNQKDTAYWKQARPIPLTEEEQIDYVKKEALAIKRESKVYLDSLDKANNKIKPIGFIIGTGYNPRNRFKKEYFQFGSMINSLFYNTVEGFGINYRASYSKQIDSLTNKFLRYTGKLRYGISSEKFYASFSASIPVKSSRIMFNAGSDVLDLSDQESIPQLGNSINSLYYERNLLKLYESKFLNLSYLKQFGSVQTSFGTEWSNRNSLQNTSDYSIRDLKSREFSSNNPFVPGFDLPVFPENQALKIKFRASYAFSNDYATYPSGKFYRPSNYPLLGINYEKGIPGVFGSDVDYSRISLDLTKSDIKLGLLGHSAFWLGAGKFLNTNNLYYTDYKHFVGTQTLGYTPRVNSFLFLDYYNFSTADQYLEGHFEHNFSGFLFNKLPLLRKLKLNELAGFNYLGTPATNSYSEFYLGIKYLNFRALYGWSYLNGKKADFGFRIATGL